MTLVHVEGSGIVYIYIYNLLNLINLFELENDAAISAMICIYIYMYEYIYIYIYIHNIFL